MNRIVLVLKNSVDFSFSDVLLISRHINKKWKGEEEHQVIVFWDKATIEIDLGNLKIIPLNNNLQGWWSRMDLYSPKYEYLRPFLYIDLDTAIMQSVETLFEAIKGHEDKWITLEDFYQSGRLATGLAWFPKNNQKIDAIWKAAGRTIPAKVGRMDNFLRSVTTADMFFQNLTPGICDFKPGGSLNLLKELPRDAKVVCFHGKPRIPKATFIKWVDKYIKEV